MNVKDNKNDILELLRGFDKPSIIRFDESHINYINSIHCIIQFVTCNIYILDELMDINFEKTLFEQSSRVLVNITSNANLRKINIEVVAKILSIKTDSVEYHFNWQIDSDYDDNHFDSDYDDNHSDLIFNFC